MNDLLQTAFATTNLPMTILFGLVVLYWLFVILGFLDLDLFDIDLDLDVDMDAGAVATLFSFGAVPFMLILSLFVFFSWNLTMLGSYYLPISLGWMIYLPVLFGGFVFTRIISIPLKHFFKKLDDSDQNIRSVEAQVGTMLADNDGVRLSQCRIKTKGAPLLATVKARPGQVLTKGQTVIIVEKDENKDFFYAEELDDWE